MALYIVQHGIARDKADDPEQGLSDKGVEQINRIGGVAAHYQVQPSIIVHSGKKRALATAEIFAQYLQPPGGVQEWAGLAPLDDVGDIAQRLKAGDNLMIVGHLPFLEKLISWLITGTREYLPFKLQNGGIVCLDRSTENDHWHVKWALMPNVD